MTSSLEKFGQFVRQQRQKNGWTQLELSVKVFGSPRYQFIGHLERNKLAGITFSTADKIMLALGSELEFREYEK
ncbi:helix-turn-helix domain-containing protein [Lutibacter sp.]|uniref:helix-turn-helix domain-containing protein n=1 Tax=Lutibacter sp. TaxID=1925666 RepID=UPI0035623F38